MSLNFWRKPFHAETGLVLDCVPNGTGATPKIKFYTMRLEKIPFLSCYLSTQFLHENPDFRRGIRASLFFRDFEG